MATWSEFREAAPSLAVAGERLFRRGDVDEALLATVRANEPPRIHPIWIRIVDGRLYAFILRSPKLTDLERDGRYALHAHQDPAVPAEFTVRGHASVVEDPEARTVVAGSWYFDVDDSYRLVEFGVESALLGERASADEWPPRYSSWAAPHGAAASTSRDRDPARRREGASRAVPAPASDESPRSRPSERRGWRTPPRR